MRLLSQAGAKAVIADLNKEAGTALAQELGTSAVFVPTNVVEEGSVQAAVQTAVQNFGGLHVLINCAGIGVAERVLGRSGAGSLVFFTRVIQINLIGTFNTIRLAVASATCSA